MKYELKNNILNKLIALGFLTWEHGIIGEIELTMCDASGIKWTLLANFGEFEGWAFYRWPGKWTTMNLRSEGRLLDSVIKFKQQY